MTDDKREKRGLRAWWRERTAHGAEGTAQAAEQAAQKAEERARTAQVKQAHDAAQHGQRGSGSGL